MLLKNSARSSDATSVSLLDPSRQPEDVAAAAGAVGAHARLLNRKAGAPQARLEAAVRASRPDGQDALRPQRPARSLQTPDVVEAGGCAGRPSPRGPVFRVQ